MSALDLTLYEALVTANIPKETAQTVVRELNSAIDRRYELNSQQLAKKEDMVALQAEISQVHREIAELKTEMVKWCTGTGIAISSVVIAAIKLL